MVDLLLIAVGVAILYFGGELLVSSVSHLALAFSISPLVVGLTVVAFGTSAPELAASVVAAINNEPELAVGNVIGSNIANVGLILGISALIAPLAATARFVWREVIFMIVTALLLLAMILTGHMGRLPALALLVLLAIFLRMLTRGGQVPTGERGPDSEHHASRWRGVLGSVAGLALLTFGADVLVRGAVGLAKSFGVSTEVIGLTLVALGTSVPELASCLVAIRRREGEIVLGNVIGSNVFNTLLILPSALLIRPLDGGMDGLGQSVVIMVGFSVALLLCFFHGSRLSRGEGALLLAGYVGYIAYLAVQSLG